MSAQPTALRLADSLEDDLHADDGTSLGLYSQGIADNAAAELRRLYDLNRKLTEKSNREIVRNARLEETNHELLEALQALCDAADDSDGCRYGTLSTKFVRDIACAAIAKAEGI